MIVVKFPYGFMCGVLGQYNKINIIPSTIIEVEF